MNTHKTTLKPKRVEKRSGKSGERNSKSGGEQALERGGFGNFKHKLIDWFYGVKIVDAAIYLESEMKERKAVRKMES